MNILNTNVFMFMISNMNMFVLVNRNMFTNMFTNMLTNVFINILIYDNYYITNMFLNSNCSSSPT